MFAFIFSATTINVTTAEIAYLVVAAIVGLVAEFIVGWRLPLGFIGAILASLAGIWVFTYLIPLNINGDPILYGIPIIRTLIGAILFVIIWHALTFGAWRSRGRYYRRERRYRRERDRY
ncbi:MAG TPA: hypothetical protein VEV19_08880 [Ktedonobacteraceae bacterium]|nr:hypothetical protein [Ktedonobacteraceae bacterium]